MTDFTHHTPRLLSDADAAADLAGLPRPVSTADAQALAAVLIVHAGDHKDVAYECDMNPVHTLNWKHYEASLSASKALLTLLSERDALAGRVRELEAERDTPHLHNFSEAVTLEALHQRERWGSEHDAGKKPADWFWLVGYLAGKALHAQAAGNTDKALHHTISTAAALANWHAAITGDHTAMRPGIDDAALSTTPESKP